MRIREYGERFYDKLVPTLYEDETEKELQELYTLRAQLIKTRKALLTSETGRKHQPMRSIYAYTHVHSVLGNLDTEIESIDAEIKKVMFSNKDMKENYELATSIKGIGPVIATDLIIKTGNFKVIDTARKAASYAGVCPFQRNKDRTFPVGSGFGRRSKIPYNEILQWKNESQENRKTFQEIETKRPITFLKLL